MTRLCDDVLTNPIWNLAAKREGSFAERRLWQTYVTEAERFEVSPILQMLLGQAVHDGTAEAISPTHSPSLRLPYPSCWVEGLIPEHTMVGDLEARAIRPLRERIRRIGALFLGWHDDNEASENISAQLVWQRPNREQVEIESFCAALKYQGDNTITEPWKPFGGVWGSASRHGYGLDTMANALLHALTLLHCKNVGSEVIQPPVKVQEKRAKRGRSKLFSYRELTVKVGGTQRRVASLVTGAHRDLRLHSVRGHFKHFTEDRPAFGKLTGTFWCPPFLKGHGEFGVVEKDYRLETANA